jgi:hypothetical protein
MPSAVRWGLGWWVAGIVIAGCHQMFDGEIDTFRCEANGVFGPPACPVGETCVAGLCTDVGVPFGYVCESDEVCPAGSYCLDPTTFGADGPSRCTHLCCGSADCGPPEEGHVCWLPPSATGGFCWPAAELERAEPGAGRPGESCDTHNDCRSGECGSGVCVGACCGDSYCEGELVCRIRLSDISEREAFSCGAPGGPMPNGLCNSDDDCASGRCVDAGVDSAGDPLSICAGPCCSSTDCVEVIVDNVPRPVACESTSGTLRACSRLMVLSSTGLVGALCADGEDCRSGICLEMNGERLCSDSRCDDESCGDSSAFACLPVKEGETWALRCLPK